MKRGSTFFLRGAVALIGILALTLCFFLWPGAGWDDAPYSLLVIIMYAAAIPFFIALYQAWRLLSYIDKNQAFSNASIRALRFIKDCGIAIGILYAAGMPFVYQVAQEEDAPGIVVVGMVIIFAAVVVAIFAGVLQKLLQNVIDIKSENDLTV